MKIVLLLLLAASPLLAVDTVYLRGQVKLPDGAAPGKGVDIMLVCGGADSVRMLSTGKNGVFNLKAERDDFNHIARALPTTGMALSDGATYTGRCVLKGVLKGYDSSSIDLSSFTIGKDLKLPDLVLSPKTAAHK
ncbi:MAG: hypothetical protein WBY44_36765 [Bryobacteraceae bacterium]|jgi:hypothetical protein